MAVSSSSHIEIVPLSSEHRQPVINLVLASFFLQEPLNAALQFELPLEPLSWVEYVVDGAMKDHFSFVAINTNSPFRNVVGVALNGISNRAHKEELPEQALTSEKLRFVFKLMDQISDGSELFELLKTDRLFHCDIINVDESQRGQNLSSHLVNYSLDQARKQGIKGAYVICSSLFSRKAFERNGFHAVKEILYTDYDKTRLHDMGVHDRCTLLIKQL